MSEIAEWERSLEAGNISGIEALHRWTFIAGDQRMTGNFDYERAIKRWLPKIEWHKSDDECYERGGFIPVTWKSAADFYVFADRVLGHTFRCGEFLRQYVQAESPEREQEVIEKFTQAEKAKVLARDESVEVGEHRRPTKEEHENKADKNENIRFNDYGTSASYRVAKLKRDHPEIAERLADGEFKSVAQAERAAQGIPEPIRRTPVYFYADDPSDAAAAIRTKYGDKFLQQLKEEI